MSNRSCLARCREFSVGPRHHGAAMSSRLPLAIALCVMAAACSAGGANGSGADVDADQVTDSVTASPPATNNATSTPTTSPTPVTSVTTVDSVEPTDQPGTPGSSLVVDPNVVPAGSEATFDPSFELGPDVSLDVSADAPIGVGDDDSPIPTSGWAAFDSMLESKLIGPGNTAASVAVSIGGEIVHRAAFGVRNPATGDPADVDDRFRIASISKPITAIVALRLVEDGIIGIDDPVGELVADHLGLGAGARSSRALTMRQLLTHTSGFGSFTGAFFGGGATDCPDAARQGLAGGANGGGYRYSNMNYCVVAMVIEALTGLSYEEATYRYLLTPLGISGMRLTPTFDPGPDETQHVTTPGRNYMETLGGAGAWIATPGDIVTIFNSLDVSTDGFKPMSADTVLAMVIPPGGTLGQRGYGLGLISYGDGRVGHTGTLESTHAMVLNRGDSVTWAITVAGQSPGESTDLERIINSAFVAGGFVSG